MTPASLRACRRRRSSSAPLAPGRVGEAKTTNLLPRAVATALTPPGGAAIRRASPPPAGSNHSAGLSWPTSPSGPPARAPGARRAVTGSGRLETNSTEPSGRNSGPPSPSALRVSRTGPPGAGAARAGGPPGPGSPSARTASPGTAIRQMLVTYFGSLPTVCTAAASQDPSGDNRSAVTRGIAT